MNIKPWREVAVPHSGSTMLRVNKIKLAPNKAQDEYFRKSCGVARHAYMVQRTQRRTSFKSSSNCCSRSGDAMNPNRV